jgi:hypothetical protein
LLHFNDTVYFKFKLQLKFTNKNPSPVIVISIPVYAKQYVYLTLKSRKEKVTERSGLLTGTLSLVSCLNHLSSASRTSLHSDFQNSIILYSFRSNAQKVFILFFLSFRLQNLRDQIPNTRHFFFISISLITFTFSSMIKIFVCDYVNNITLLISC